LKTTTETIGPREVLLTVEPDPQTVEKALRKAAQVLSRWRPLPGFRPGRAPYALVERTFGREALLERAVNELAPELYRQAIAEAQIEPFDQGQLEIGSQDPLVLKFRVPLGPVVTLGDYRALHIEPEPEVVVTEAQIDEEIEAIRRRHATYEVVDRPVQLGDQVVATIVGTHEGQEIVNHQDATLNVVDLLRPAGFAEALVGMRAGESREFSLTYPEDYDDENLAGKNVTFNVTIKTVRQANLPEINDDLAKMAGDYETLAEMREGLAAALKERLENEARAREANAAIEALVSVSQVEYPAVALEREISATIENQKARLRQIGFTYENYLRMIGKTEAELREEIRPEAERRLVRELVLAEFARAEKLEVKKEEISAEAERIASRYGERANEVLERLSTPRATLSIHADLLTQAAVKHLTDLLTGRKRPQAEATAESTESAPAAEAQGADAAPSAEDKGAPEG